MLVVVSLVRVLSSGATVCTRVGLLVDAPSHREQKSAGFFVLFLSRR